MLILIMMVFIAPLTYSKLNLKVVGGNCNWTWQFVFMLYAYHARLIKYSLSISHIVYAWSSAIALRMWQQATSIYFDVGLTIFLRKQLLHVGYITFLVLHMLSTWWRIFQGAPICYNTLYYLLFFLFIKEYTPLVKYVLMYTTLVSL